MLTLDTAALHTKWVRDIYDEQARNIAAGLGACAPNIAPTEDPGLQASDNGVARLGCGAPPWAIAAIVLPYNLWRYHGDAQIIARYYSRMQLFMQWLDSTADNSTGLVSQDGLAVRLAALAASLSCLQLTSEPSRRIGAPQRTSRRIQSPCRPSLR